MEGRKTKAEEYCKRVDQIIREMDEDKPIEEIQAMIDELSDCEENLKKIKAKYEEEGERLFEKNGGGTDSFEALATENMLKKINWVLEEISSFVGVAQTFITENSKEKTEMVEETVSKNLPEEDEMPEIDVIKVVPIEPINWEEIQPKTSLDNLPQFFGEDSEEQEIEAEDDSIYEVTDRQEGAVLEVEDDIIYSKEKAQEEEELELESDDEEELLEEPDLEEEEELPKAQFITIDMRQPAESDYIEMAEKAIKERKGMTDPAKVAGDGGNDSRAILLKIQRVLMPEKVASKGKSKEKPNVYEREIGDE